MFLTIILFFLGLALIFFGANYLVDGSSFVARRFGISEFVVGLTIVGIGTSTPEMVVSFISSFKGLSDIAIGNVVGSNIANVFLILGVTSIISPILLTKDNIRKDIPFSFFVSFLLFLMSYDALLFGGKDNILSRLDGFILLLIFALFMFYSFKTSSRSSQLSRETAAEDSPDDKENRRYNKMCTRKYGVAIAVLKITGGLAGLIFGGQLFVNSGTAIASALGVSDAYIGITVIALGTSLPEFAASVVAAIRKKGQMALGNIIGSINSNILLILGGSSIIRPLTLGNITVVDFSVMMSTSVLLLLCAHTFKKNFIDKWEGLIFFMLYIGYIVYLTTNI